MLSISYMEQPEYSRVNPQLLVKPKTQQGLEAWSKMYIDYRTSQRNMNIDGYGYKTDINDKKMTRRKPVNFLNSSEIGAKFQGVGEEKRGNDDLGYESYDDEEEAIYLVAKFIEVHEELLRYSGYNLWMMIELRLYDNNIRAIHRDNLTNVLQSIVKDSDLNVGEQVSEALKALQNKRCSQKLIEHFAS